MLTWPIYIPSGNQAGYHVWNCEVEAPSWLAVLMGTLPSPGGGTDVQSNNKSPFYPFSVWGFHTISTVSYQQPQGNTIFTTKNAMKGQFKFNITNPHIPRRSWGWLLLSASQDRWGWSPSTHTVLCCNSKVVLGSWSEVFENQSSLLTSNSLLPSSTSSSLGIQKKQNDVHTQHHHFHKHE